MLANYAAGDQHQRIEVALHRDAVLHAVADQGRLRRPVDADGVDAGGVVVFLPLRTRAAATVPRASAITRASRKRGRIRRRFRTRRRGRLSGGITGFILPNLAARRVTET